MPLWHGSRIDFQVPAPSYSTMKIPLYQLDAFTSKPFAGNPAAVCPLETWLDDATMQAIATENNLSETAFFVPEDEGFHLRWFTPATEVALCGHATLATAWVIFHRFDWQLQSIDFRTRSGALTAARDDDRLALNFPSQPAAPARADEALATALGALPQDTLVAGNGNVLAVLAGAQEVRALKPDFAKIARLDTFGVIATGPGASGVDFVSRYFVPKAGINEDPVTGSAHCTLTPYWARRLGKKSLYALQVSARGGELWCEDRGDRTILAGHCVPVIEGTLII
jgi:PhzF family phenazine biosynthesis protein